MTNRFAFRHRESEPVPDIAAAQALERRIHLVQGKDLHVGGDAVVAAEGEHLARAGNPAATCRSEALSTEEKGERVELRLTAHPHDAERPIESESIEVRIEVVRTRGCIKDEVMPAPLPGHLLRASADDRPRGAKARRLTGLFLTRGEDSHLGAECCGELHCQVPQATE